MPTHLNGLQSYPNTSIDERQLPQPGQLTTEWSMEGGRGEVKLEWQWEGTASELVVRLLRTELFIRHVLMFLH